MPTPDYFPPMLEEILQECEDTIRMCTVDADQAGDIGPLLEALREGKPMPPEAKSPVAKAGRTDFGADPVANRVTADRPAGRVAKSDWDEEFEVSTSLTKSAPARFSYTDLSDEQKQSIEEKDQQYLALVDRGVSPCEAHHKVYGSTF